MWFVKKTEKYSTILLAAGESKRFGQDKLVPTLVNKPVFLHSLLLFLQDTTCEKIFFIINESNISEYKNILKELRIDDSKIDFTVGGDTRFLSCFKGIEKVSSKKVLIHDAARPLLTKELIKESLQGLDKIHQGSIVCSRVVNTIKSLDKDEKLTTLDRDSLLSVETPQSFETDIIKKCYELAIEAKDEKFFDDSSVVEKYNPDVKIKIIFSKNCNIKITNPADLVFADYFLKNKE